MIQLRGKNVLLVEAHAHVWNHIHGRRFDTDTHEPLSCGRTRCGGRTTQFLPPEFEDCRSSIEVFRAYEQLLGIDKAVLLQNPCYGEQYEYINEVLRQSPDRYVTVGVPNPQNRAEYMQTVDLCLGRYGYKGLKFECPDIPFDMLAPENAFVFETLEKYNACCMIDMGWGDGPHDFPIDTMRKVVRRHPNLTFIFPHLGVSRLWDPAEHSHFDSLKRTLSMLEENDNLWFDLAGLPGLSTRAGQEYPFPMIEQAIMVVRSYGAINRLMWGSDYPTALLSSTYQQHIDAVTRHCDLLTDQELENIMGLTADKVWFGNA